MSSRGAQLLTRCSSAPPRDVAALDERGHQLHHESIPFQKVSPLDHHCTRRMPALGQGGNYRCQDKSKTAKIFLVLIRTFLPSPTPSSTGSSAWSPSHPRKQCLNEHTALVDALEMPYNINNCLHSVDHDKVESNRNAKCEISNHGPLMPSWKKKPKPSTNPNFSPFDTEVEFSCRRA